MKSEEEVKTEEEQEKKLLQQDENENPLRTLMTELHENLINTFRRE